MLDGEVPTFVRGYLPWIGVPILVEGTCPGWGVPTLDGGTGLP